ncbi:MAG: acyl-CoA dehydrogenase [Caulobacteraceae bacterium]|nr:MAG: acyl-CoA dehydrogenase [Caulobacteraceae bacterium]
MRIAETYQAPFVERSGFDADLTLEERGIVEAVHRFSREVLRPLGRKLDRMSAADVAAPGSPLFGAYVEFAKLGIDPLMLDSMAPDAASRLECLIMEEIGWGDGGLGVSLAVAAFPLQVAHASGKKELVELATGRIGCWPITQPDHGSDFVDTLNRERQQHVKTSPGNLSAKFSKDEIVINGQTSAWVSNGPVAQIASLCCPADFGDGIVRADGVRNMAVMIVPLDLKGVSRGMPLEKMGQNALPQGEIFFDNVRIPRRWAVAEEASGAAGFLSILAMAGVFMSQCFTGVARAAFELALDYAHERKQGGELLIRHQLVRWRIGEMYKKVEAARAMTRRASLYLRAAPAPHPNVSSMSKAFVTQAAFEVASEAVQILGGAGLTKEYEAEKLFRDARTALIEDGENYFLTLRLGTVLSDLYDQGWTRN